LATGRLESLSRNGEAVFRFVVDDREASCSLIWISADPFHRLMVPPPGYTLANAQIK
jgi:hypothetical protein